MGTTLNVARNFLASGLHPKPACGEFQWMGACGEGRYGIVRLATWNRPG